MPLVASVRLRYASQDYWFDPAGLELKAGDHVLVETSKGTEIGLCTHDVTEVDEAEVTKPLKPVVRIATEEDLAKSDEIAARDQEALAVFHELVEKNHLDMSPSAVEFSFDESHATFYFTSDERVDFRGLVRDLAAEFHTRVDMRQIGPRDEARMLGGLGHCGEELCCARLGGEFQPVSIRMAKEQDLPLNPTKISGLCGRLMCCLRYEYEAYKDFKGRAPKKNALIDTPAGMGKVVEFDTPRETVRLRMEDGSSLILPVSSLDTGDKVPREGERIRPCHISQENFDKIMEELSNDSNLAMMGEKLFSDDPNLADATAEGGSLERVHRRKRGSSGSSSRGSSGDSGRKPRKRGASSSSEPKPRDERKRRRSVSATDGSEIKHDDSARKKADDSKDGQSSGNGSRSRNRRRRSNGKPRQGGQGTQNKDNAQGKGQGSSRPRPGQHSSTVSGNASQGNGSNGSNGSGSKPRRRRRRGGTGNGNGSGKPSEGKASE
ncbi:MAG: stage 0 sporulation family protein [Coriobacteriales bacterium]